MVKYFIALLVLCGGVALATPQNNADELDDVEWLTLQNINLRRELLRRDQEALDKEAAEWQKAVVVKHKLDAKADRLDGRRIVRAKNDKDKK